MVYLKVGLVYIMINNIDKLNFKEGEYIYEIKEVEKDCSNSRLFNSMTFEEFKMSCKKGYKGIIRDKIKGERICYYTEKNHDYVSIVFYIEFEKGIFKIEKGRYVFFQESIDYYGEINLRRIFTKKLDRIHKIAGELNLLLFDHFKFIRINNFVYKIKYSNKFDETLTTLKRVSIYKIIEVENYNGPCKLIKELNDLFIFADINRIKQNVKRFEYVLDDKLYIFSLNCYDDDSIKIFLDDHIEYRSTIQLKRMYENEEFDKIPEGVFEKIMFDFLI